MPSLSANFFNYVCLPLLGAKKRMSNPEIYKKNFSESPKACPPPKKLYKNFDISEGKMDSGLEFFFINKKYKEGKDLIIYLHGGAYVNNLVEAHWRIIRDLMLVTDVDIIAPLYALAPHFTWVTAFEQLRGLYLNLSAENPDREIIIAGDSAGGGLALAFSQMLRDENLKPPKALILFSPWLDVSMTDKKLSSLQRKDKMLAIPGAKWAGEKWAGETKTTDPRVSPIYGSMKNLPPIVVFSGSADILYADVLRLKTIVRQNNLNINIYEYPELFHVWVGAPIPEAKQAFKQVSNFINNL